MTAHTSARSSWAARTVRTTLHLMAWTVAWVASLALAKFGPGTLWTEQTATTVAVIGFNILIGLGMLLANKRHLQALDELQRTVQLHAMAWALGAGLVGGASWTLMERHGLIAFEAQIGHVLILMTLVYIVAIIVGTRRYQ